MRQTSFSRSRAEAFTEAAVVLALASVFLYSSEPAGFVAGAGGVGCAMAGRKMPSRSGSHRAVATIALGLSIAAMLLGLLVLLFA